MADNVAWVVRRHDRNLLGGEVIEDVAMCDTPEHARDHVRHETIEVSPTPSVRVFGGDVSEVWTFLVPTFYSIEKVRLERPFEDYQLWKVRKESR